MAITKRSEAKEGGFAQVRAALISFKGKVKTATFDKWGGTPVKEYFEVVSTGNTVLKAKEELGMDISNEWSFRINTSDYKGSFWVEKFLESADKAKVLIPEGIVDKLVTWEQVTLEAFAKDGTRKPEFDSTNFVIVAVEDATGTPGTVAVPATVTTPPAVAPSAFDPMAFCLNLAAGKTEQQFRSAASLAPELAGSPFLSMVKAGLVTDSLVKEGKLVKVKDGTKETYKKV
jgi:hypothetical protein